MAAEGATKAVMAERLRIGSQRTVGRWRKRFASGRVDGLFDEPVPLTIGDDEIAETIRRTLETMPADATHWRLRSLAKTVGLALSTDPSFVEKMRDVVGLYLNPPQRAVVLCFDEKSQIQALDRTQPLLPIGPGQVERHTHDYVRHGTTSLFAALDVATGKVIGRCFARHRAAEFGKFLDTVETAMPKGLDVHLAMDNSSTHKTKLIRDWFAKRPHWRMHFTPTTSSWINQVERFFALLTEKQIRRGVHRSTGELEAAINGCINATNAEPKPFPWTSSADDILVAINRFYKRTIDEHHSAIPKTSESGH
jgi:DDE superfamily endonuclease